MTQIETILAEIEWLKNWEPEAIPQKQRRKEIQCARLGVLIGLEDFINSISDEKPSENLEEAAKKKYTKENCILPEDCNDGDNPSYEKCTATVFKDGANWQEEKELLLKDLCARLPYGVIVQDRNGTHKLSVGNTEFADLFAGKCNIRAYLRPLSSMTEEEKKEIQFLKLDLEASSTDVMPKLSRIMFWYYKHHFDVNGLIPMGLALKAPEDIYTTTKSNTLEDIKYGTDKIVTDAKPVVISPEEMKEMEDMMYDEHGWKNIGNGLKMDRSGHIAGGLKILK